MDKCEGSDKLMLPVNFICNKETFDTEAESRRPVCETKSGVAFRVVQVIQ